jgi:NAD(P)H-flavin reductase
MLNIYQPIGAKIKTIKQETKSTKLFALEFLDKKISQDFVFAPGQIIEIGLPGFGEAAVAICSAPQSKKYFEIAVRSVGQLTERIHQLKVGDRIMIRGPFGRGFLDTKDSDALLIAGGMGIVPMRSFVLSQINQKLGGKITIIYGTKAPDQFLFAGEFARWEKDGIKIYQTVDKKDKNWSGEVGPVTVLIDKLLKGRTIAPPKTAVILCGPPQMYEPVIEKLLQNNFFAQNIYLSLERRMSCGVGICQHCAIGPKYVCKDGPLFPWSEIKDIYNVI